MELNVGFSDEIEFDRAIRSALSEALKGVKESYFFFIFITENYSSVNNYILIKEIFKEKRFVGSTTAGIIYKGNVYLRGVGVVAFGRGFNLLYSSVKEGLSESGRAVGEKLAEECQREVHSKEVEGVIEKHLCFIFPDGVASNIESMIKGLSFKLPAINYVGGGSGDNLRFLKTIQFSNKSFTQDSVAIAVFDCSGDVGIGVAHGFRPISKFLIATSVDGNILKQIDWNSALKFYCSFLKVPLESAKGEIAKVALSNPIGVVQLSHFGESFIIRDIISSDDEGFLHTIGEIPHNSTICIMEGDRESLKGAALVAARNAKLGISGEVSCYLIFSCVSRYVHLGESYYKKNEIDSIESVLGSDIPHLGILTFGEISCVGRSLPYFHNKTVVVSAFSK